ncbi:MAG TPA: DNA topoisomerase VI subunit B [Bdellovibrionota bacterium]|nr:DNA topoisomerase VI subunit B [Bdellovibrionota bacterium]
MSKVQKITSSSTAEYFSKNLQQVGFSSPTKAVLTTLKEAVDNSLDACEDSDILPEIDVLIEKLQVGTRKNVDIIKIRVTDNGPGLAQEDLSKVYGEYLASSKFGRGRCSRGQQGIGISAATTWGQLTTATGVRVITKTSKMKTAISALVEVDIKKNQGVIKDKSNVNWDRPHGTSVEFVIEGRMQLNGDGGILTYLSATSLSNPHLTLKYRINEEKPIVMDRVTDEIIGIPEAVPPHPHTMKLGEVISHAHLFGKSTLDTFLKKGFSRVSDQTISAMIKAGCKKGWFKEPLTSLDKAEVDKVYSSLQEVELMPPSTRSVLRIGEEALSKSIQRLGEVDFFSVVSRKPKIADFKPVVVEVGISRLKTYSGETDDSVTVLRFANRVPLQFDKAACAIIKAIESVNWKSYGIAQSKNSIPTGPYIIAVSVVSPFIKFKNASKETIDASDELVEELRLALMQAGQKLSRFIRSERKAEDLEKKIRHIEQFGPVLIQTIGRITSAPPKRIKAAEEGLRKILGRDASSAEAELAVAEEKRAQLEAKMAGTMGTDSLDFGK